MPQFPKSVAAIQRRDRCMWEIGDALLEECGPPSMSGRRDQSRERIAQLISELEHLQILDYSIKFLAGVREIAHKFPQGSRRKSLSWSTHSAAGSPGMLDEIIEATPQDRRVSRDHIQAMRPLIQRQRLSRGNVERQRQGRPTVRVNTNVPLAREEPLYLADVARTSNQIRDARRALREAVRLSQPWLGRIEPDILGELVESTLSLMNEARAFSDQLQRLRRGNHLAVVEGGQS